MLEFGLEHQVVANLEHQVTANLQDYVAFCQVQMGWNPLETCRFFSNLLRELNI